MALLGTDVAGDWGGTPARAPGSEPIWAGDLDQSVQDQFKSDLRHNMLRMSPELGGVPLPSGKPQHVPSSSGIELHTLAALSGVRSITAGDFKLWVPTHTHAGKIAAMPGDPKAFEQAKGVIEAAMKAIDRNQDGGGGRPRVDGAALGALRERMGHMIFAAPGNKKVTATALMWASSRPAVLASAKDSDRGQAVLAQRLSYYAANVAYQATKGLSKRTGLGQTVEQAIKNEFARIAFGATPLAPSVLAGTKSSSEWPSRADAGVGPASRELSKLEGIGRTAQKLLTQRLRPDEQAALQDFMAQRAPGIQTVLKRASKKLRKAAKTRYKNHADARRVPEALQHVNKAAAALAELQGPQSPLSEKTDALKKDVVTFLSTAAVAAVAVVLQKQNKQRGLVKVLTEGAPGILNQLRDIASGEIDFQKSFAEFSSYVGSSFGLIPELAAHDEGKNHLKRRFDKDFASTSWAMFLLTFAVPGMTRKTSKRTSQRIQSSNDKPLQADAGQAAALERAGD